MTESTGWDPDFDLTRPDPQRLMVASSDLVPVVNLTRELVSRMTSMMSRRPSPDIPTGHIGIHDLAEHLSKFLGPFPPFVQLVKRPMPDRRQEELQAEENNINQVLNTVKETRARINGHIQKLRERLDEAQKDHDPEKVQRRVNDRRAACAELGRVVVQMRTVMQEVEELRQRNAELARQLAQFGRSRTSCGVVEANIIKIAGELVDIRRYDVEVCGQIEKEIERLEASIATLKQRREDVQKRMGAVKTAVKERPVRQPANPLRIERGIPRQQRYR
jgi:chaperonin cofactor prefoldin